MIGKLIAVFACIAFVAGAADTTDPYRREVEQWRAEHQSEIAKDFGWLTVVGLDWLKEGDNRIGADPSSEVPLPPGSALRQVAVISWHASNAILHPAPGVRLTLNGKPATVTSLREDDDVLAINHLQFFLILRGDRAGIRLKDNDSAARKHFQGLSWYPADPSWRIQAKFTPWPAPHSLSFHNTIGQEEHEPSPGYVTFQKDGREFRLEPMLDDGKLFFVIRDETSGKTTYGASRFLYAEPAKNGIVFLDFNKSENPPCAFTSYATCPLPPPRNRLSLAIRAGEKKYAGSDH
ncbi:MAG: DUF1684 domain-containing protein [Bryobacteraceae bacterium]